MDVSGMKYRIMYFQARMAVNRCLNRIRAAFKPWVHTPHDGRGLRDVYLDGKPIDHVIYAETRRGVVRMHHHPFRRSKTRDQVISYKRKGRVEVYPMIVSARRV